MFKSILLAALFALSSHAIKCNNILLHKYKEQQPVDYTKEPMLVAETNDALPVCNCEVLFEYSKEKLIRTSINCGAAEEDKCKANIGDVKTYKGQMGTIDKTEVQAMECCYEDFCNTLLPPFNMTAPGGDKVGLVSAIKDNVLAGTKRKRSINIRI